MKKGTLLQFITICMLITLTGFVVSHITISVLSSFPNGRHTETCKRDLYQITPQSQDSCLAVLSI